MGKANDSQINNDEVIFKMLRKLISEWRFAQLSNEKLINKIEEKYCIEEKSYEISSK